MKAFKKRGALTHFQILSEISKQNPHLKMADHHIKLLKKVLTKLKEMLFLLENTLILFWKP